jgi:hypothetical protein
MKLSSSHFTAVQDFVTDSLRDAIALQITDLNYGLQPVAGDSVKMHVLMDHYNQLQFFIKQQKKDTIYYEEINNYINVNIFCMY